MVTDTEPIEAIIGRDHHLDIKARGWFIAVKSSEIGSATLIYSLFQTVQGRFILHIEKDDSTWGKSQVAEVFGSPREVIEALRDEEHTFGILEKQVIQLAAQNSREFFGLDVVIVE